MVDLILYSSEGREIGRESPAMGGPRTFEPACSFSGWHRIAAPPIPLEWMPDDTGKTTARRYPGEPLPNRTWTPPQRRPAARRVSGLSNFDPELEIKARLMAAQELRDTARRFNLPVLVERAIVLEQEAATLTIDQKKKHHLIR